MKVNKSNLKIALTLTALFLAIAIPVAAFGYYFTYHFSATVGVNEEAVAYEDVACTSPISEYYDWGPIEDGETLVVWIRNDGNVPVDVSVTISAEVGCTVVLSWPSKTFGLNQIEQLTMTVSTSVSDGSTISWDLDIDANKTP